MFAGKSPGDFPSQHIPKPSRKAPHLAALPRPDDPLLGSSAAVAAHVGSREAPGEVWNAAKVCCGLGVPDDDVGIAIINHPPITINGWYKPSNIGGLLLLYPHYLLGMIASGKCLHNYGKSLSLMGKSTISMAIFHSYVSLPEGTWHLGLGIK